MKFIEHTLELLLFLSFFLYSWEYSAKNKEKSNIPIEVPTVYTMSTMKPIINSNLEAITKKFKKINGPIFVKVDNVKETKQKMTNDTTIEHAKNETNNTNDIKEKVKMLENKLNEYEQQLNQLIISSKNNSEKGQTHPSNDVEKKQSKEDKQNETPQSKNNTKTNIETQKTSNQVNNTQTAKLEENHPAIPTNDSNKGVSTQSSQNDKSKEKNNEKNKEISNHLSQSSKKEESQNKNTEGTLTQPPEISNKKEESSNKDTEGTPTQTSKNNKEKEKKNNNNNHEHPIESQISQSPETKDEDTKKETKQQDEKKEIESTKSNEPENGIQKDDNKPTIKSTNKTSTILNGVNHQKEKEETNSIKDKEKNTTTIERPNATSPETSQVTHDENKTNSSQPNANKSEFSSPKDMKKNETVASNNSKNQKENEGPEETNEDVEEEEELARKNYHLRHQAFIQKDIMFPNPCYNKGYISKEKRTIGTGNYSQCFFSNSHKQETIISSNLRINSNYTLLTQTEKKLAQLLFPNNNNFTYYELKKKVKKICSMTYSEITQEYSEILTENAIDNLCLNLTLFSIYLETLQNMNEESFIIKEPVESQIQFEGILPKTSIKQQKESIIPTSTSLITILSNPQIKNYFYLVCICLLCLGLLYILNERIVNFINGVYSNKIMNQKIDYSFIQDQLSYQNVKYYLFYSDTSAFKTKYGKEFKVKNLINEDLIEEVRLMSLNDKNLKDLMKNNKIIDFKWKISLGLYTFNLICALFGVVIFVVLLSKIWSIYGFKSALAVCLGFNLFLGIFLVLLFVCMKIEVEGKRKI